LNKSASKIGQSNLLSLIAPTTAALSVLIISPYLMMDAANPIKFFLVTTLSAGFLVIFFLNLRVFKDFKKNVIFWLVLLFVLLSVVLTITNSNNLDQQLYGVKGRQTGLILHLALCGLLIAGNIFASTKVLKQSIKLFLITGLLAGLYGMIQILDLDPIDWANQSSWISATLANPNFYSSFMGMLVCVMLPYIFSHISLQMRLVLICGVIISTFIVIKTRSLQGLIVELLGVIITLFFVIKVKTLSKKWLHSYVFFAILGLIILLLDILQKVPWQSFLYKASVSARGDYWRAGIAVIEKNPLTGVGFDGLRDQYGLVREEVSLTRGDAYDLDAAHNVFIDKGIAGGIPLLLIYILIIVAVLFAIRRLVLDFKVFDPAIVSLISCWIAWLAQSVISIDNVGLTSWGWYLAGLITGLAAISKSPDTKFSKIGSRFNLRQANKSYLIGIIIGAIVAMPLLTREYRFIKSIERGDITGLTNAALQFPQDLFRIGKAAETLKDNKIENESIYLVRQGVKNFPESFSAWALLYTSPWSTEEERKVAKIKLRQLDPLRAKDQGLE
jgi:O-antigen ligase